ncbi:MULTISPECIES: aldo/keto reductase [Thermocrispum]|jgi:diketogulonate reductase-like aldo/keto reductase|uniref:Aldo/keto reductase n=1 Tax=Thermocrispum agreste TaxID=37925 RepID=A0A2W4LBQ4_9PSEU|nr:MULTISPECIES: aldo/keto reductase [Thermocrispum]PZM94893.1 MAG: aldo/keto reductase [Thermocrispum agreste]
MGQVPSIDLTTDVAIPQLGFGVFQVPPAETKAAVAKALQVGYRSIDTAAVYGNERQVGEAIAESGVPRQELFVTTKLWNSEQGYDSTLAAFDASMAKLGLEQLDLYLVHWPVPKRDRYLDTWRAFERLHADGRVRAIGVSNFTVDHLRRLLDVAEVPPAINQVELHPRFQQRELRAFHAEHGIATEAWAPLGQGTLIDHPVLTKIAAKHGRTSAQVMIRWHLQIGNVVIPKSVTPERIEQNFAVFDFELDQDDLDAIAALDDPHGRIGPDPETFDQV